MSQPLVSVTMVTRNVEHFLQEAIESVLGQTFRDFEFIVVDFGSTDNSKSIVSNYAAADRRIRFHEIPHCGLAEARNEACSRAQGKCIAIMDADDVYLPNRLLWEVKFMEAHPEVGVTGGAVECINAAGRVSDNLEQSYGEPDDSTGVQRTMSTVPTHSANAPGCFRRRRRILSALRTC